MRRKEIVSVLFASILILSVFSFVSAGMLSNTFRKTQITGETIESACSDSDSGKDYFNKGTIIGGGVSFVQYDYCLVLTSTGQTDVASCDASNPDCKLHEFYCENNIRKGVRTSCDYGCSNGVCNPAPIQDQLCIDSDGGMDYSESGYVSLIDHVKTFISEGDTMVVTGKTISIEYVDSISTVLNIDGEITGKLSEGDCHPTGSYKVCVDEIFYAAKEGAISKILINVVSDNTIILQDSCLNSTKLMEYTCLEDQDSYTLYDCGKEGKFCSNGACSSTPSTTETFYPAPFVVNGLADVAIIYGTQTGVSNLEIVQAANIQADLQEQTTGVGELLVKDSDFSSVLEKNLIVVGTPCSNSAIYQFLALPDCTQVATKLGLAPGKGALKPVAGYNGKTVLLVVGYGPEELVKLVTYLTTKEVVTSHSYILTVLEANQTVYIGGNCTDTDNGLNYYLKGKSYSSNQSVEGKIDCCKLGTTSDLSGPCVIEGPYLYESYCDSDIPESVAYKCPQGCRDGACISENETSCTSNFTIYEGIPKIALGFKVSIEYMDEKVVKMNINGEITSSLFEGESEELAYGKSITINDIRYSNKTSGTSNVVFTMSTNGPCIPEQSCTDTDKGINYYEKGILVDKNQVSHQDYCTNEQWGGRTVNLIEYYCGVGGARTSYGYFCPNGCKDGACLKESDVCAKYYTCPDGTKVNYCSMVSTENSAACKCAINPSSLCSNTNNTSNTNISEIPTTLTCERYYTCQDGSQVQYCFMQKMYAKNGEVSGAGCGCKSNPEMLCSSDNALLENTNSKPVSLETQGENYFATNETPIFCNGCIIGNKCAPVGYRTKGKYCALEGELASQVSGEQACENNFECRSNLCIDDECVNQGAFKRMMNWFKNSLVKKK